MVILIETVNTSSAPAAIGPYSQGKTFGDFVFTSGQIPLDPATGDVVGNDITTQAKQALSNLEQVLTAAGSSTDNVFKTTCFLADMGDFAAFNEVYTTYFKSNPARSCIAVKELPKSVLVEVEAIAVKG